MAVPVLLFLVSSRLHVDQGQCQQKRVTSCVSKLPFYREAAGVKGVNKGCKLKAAISPASLSFCPCVNPTELIRKFYLISVLILRLKTPFQL